MMTDKHRKLSNDIVNRLKTTTSIDERELRKIGDEVYDVMNWLKEYGIITQSGPGRPFTKGKHFMTYSTLDDLINPPPPKKDTLERSYKFAAIIGVLFAVVTGTVSLLREDKYQKLEGINRTLGQANDSLKRELNKQDNINIVTNQKIITSSRNDSLTKTPNYGKEER